MEERKMEMKLLFEQAIQDELNRAFAEPELQHELCEGKFLNENELITDGEWGGKYFCFDFRRFKGCKLIIGSFSQYCPHAGIWMLLFVEKNIHEIDKFLYNDEDEYRFCEFSRHLVEILDEGGEAGQWVNLVSPYPNDKKYDDDYKVLGTFNVPPGDGWLFFDSPNAIEQYRDNYQEVAHIMSERAKYWFKNGKIWEKKGDTLLSIVDFLEKYLGKKENSCVESK
jgi:hypothetical protein